MAMIHTPKEKGQSCWSIEKGLLPATEALEMEQTDTMMSSRKEEQARKAESAMRLGIASLLGNLQEAQGIQLDDQSTDFDDIGIDFPSIEWSDDGSSDTGLSNSYYSAPQRQQRLRRKRSRPTRRASGLVRSQPLLCLSSVVEPSAEYSRNKATAAKARAYESSRNHEHEVLLPLSNRLKAICTPLAPLSESCRNDDDDRQMPRHSRSKSNGGNHALLPSKFSAVSAVPLARPGFLS